MTSHNNKKKKSNISYVEIFVQVWKPVLESSSTLQKYFSSNLSSMHLCKLNPPCVHMHYIKAINYFQLHSGGLLRLRFWKSWVSLSRQGTMGPVTFKHHMNTDFFIDYRNFQTITLFLKAKTSNVYHLNDMHYSSHLHP